MNVFFYFILKFMYFCTMKKFLFVFSILYCLFSFKIFGQYIFPVDFPAGKAYLAGNVGEIRQNHFHAGIDVGIMTGTKVKASAKGYVSRITNSTSGYGKCLVITHPHLKQKTLYAHLHKFEGKIGNYLKQKQKEKKKTEIDLEISPNIIPVNMGEIIALSGNTGASAGAHLHYEIRTLDDVAIDPFMYQFKELPLDKAPPVVKKIAFYPLHINSRINNELARKEYNVIGQNGVYSVPNIINVKGAIGLEMLAWDVLQNSIHTFGISYIEMKLDQKTIYSANLRSIEHAQNRCMLVHINYEIQKKNNQAFQKCYVADGNKLKNYSHIDKGIIHLKDKKVHNLTIKMIDNWGNSSNLSLKIQDNNTSFSNQFIPDKSLTRATLQYKVIENTLMIEANYLKMKGKEAFFSFSGVNYPVKLSYQIGKKIVYLWDLRDGLPDAVEAGGVRLPLFFRKMIPPQQEFWYKSKDLMIKFPKNCLFDTLYLEARPQSHYLDLHTNFVPLFLPIEVTYFSKNVPKNAQAFAGNQLLKSIALIGGVKFNTRQLGRFFFRPDITPPLVQFIKNDGKTILLKAIENETGLDDFKAYLNGVYLPLDFDSKTNILSAEKDSPSHVLKGNLEKTHLHMF
ncbi:MAG: M23 family metallopeptidase [Cytophagales bacterium]|nr:MAG: M23 family metallopeptidase [Cytophagales bacterium]